MNLFGYLFILCLGIFPKLYSASKLNVPGVLLPYNHEYPANFTLKVTNHGGCYKW